MLAVILIIQDQKHNILLRIRHKKPDQSKWELFGKYVQEDETIEETIKRTLKEKAQLSQEQINSAIIRFTGKYYDHPNRHPNQRCVPLVFHVKTDTPLVPIQHQSQKLFTKEQIGELNFALDNKQILQDFLNNQPN